MGKIILCGPSASGKDHARKTLQNKGFTLGVSYTTRDPRPGEVDGIDYNFLTKNEFEDMIKDDMWLEYDGVDNKMPDGSVRVDYYGTTKDQFETNDLFIMTPSGIKKIPNEFQDRFIVLAFDIDKNTRVDRMRLGRGWPEDTINTRLSWDDREFKDFKADYNHKEKSYGLNVMGVDLEYSLNNGKFKLGPFKFG